MSRRKQRLKQSTVPSLTAVVEASDNLIKSTQMSAQRPPSKKPPGRRVMGINTELRPIQLRKPPIKRVIRRTTLQKTKQSQKKARAWMDKKQKRMQKSSRIKRDKSKEMHAIRASRRQMEKLEKAKEISEKIQQLSRLPPRKKQITQRPQNKKQRRKMQASRAKLQKPKAKSQRKPRNKLKSKTKRLPQAKSAYPRIARYSRKKQRKSRSRTPPRVKSAPSPQHRLFLPRRPKINPKRRPHTRRRHNRNTTLQDVHRTIEHEKAVEQQAWEEKLENIRNKPSKNFTEEL